MKQLLILLTIAISTFSALGQGTIKGRILDQDSQEGLFGATVGIRSLSKGAAADFDGNFTLSGIPAGTYTLECSYISYETQTKINFEIKDGQTYSLNFELGTGGADIEVVEVVVRVQKNSENSILLMQQRETTVMDGISSEQFVKSGSSDAASAAKKVSGVTVQGGKYVYVRGLGDRYSKTLVNGAEIPGLDPNKNSVQMDMFPTSLLDNMLIFKTFQADKPADYVGGLIDITTKQYPDNFLLSVSSSVGYNSNANFNKEFLTYDNSNNKIPSQLAGKEDLPNSTQGKLDESIANQVTANTKTFDNNMDFSTKSNPLNYSQSITIGNSKDLNDSVSIGFVGAVSYGKKYSAFYNGTNARWQLSEAVSDNAKLNNQRFYDDSKGLEEENLGLLLNVALKVSNKHNIAVNVMHNELKEKEVRYLHGTFPQNDPNLTYYTRSLQNNENKLSIAQLVGKHELKNIDVNWVSSYSASSQDQPDLRFFTYGDYIDDGDTLSKVDVSIGQLPTRYFRSMKQSNWDNKIHFTKKVKEKGEFKFGAAATFVKREFREEQFRYQNDNLVFGANIPEYIDAAWEYGDSKGVYIISAFDKRNNYDASQTVLAGYLQYKYELDKTSTVIGGVRVEKASISLESFDEEVGNAELENLDFLPSLTFIKTLSETTKIKSAITRTLARPTFRELAPFGSFQFVGQELLVGNPTLERTLVDNLDLRWEKFGKPGEFFAVSVFGKRFTNPIERVINPLATNEINFVNIDKAMLVGAEIEWKKGLGFISDTNKTFSTGFNASYIYSQINLTEDVFTSVKALDPNAKSYRPMFGQAPYTFNAFVGYESFSKRVKANLNFNISGPKMYLVMKGATPNVFEKSRADLNFNISKEIKKHWKLQASVKNILNSAQRYEQDFQNVSYAFGSYQTGTTYGFGITYKID